MAKKKVVKKGKKTTKSIKKIKNIMKKNVKKTAAKKLPDYHAVENTTRDFQNWLAVFKTEYTIAPEAYETLHNKMDEFSGSLIDNPKRAANILRDAKAWLAVFSREYNLADEVVCVLMDKLDMIGEKLGKS